MRLFDVLRRPLAGTRAGFVGCILLLCAPAFSYAGGMLIDGTGGGTGEKPQSKLWWTDQTWWAAISRSGYGLHFYEYDRFAQVWEPCAFMDANIPSSGRADVKWNGSELFVLAYKSNPKLFKYTYDLGLRTWNLALGFPVSVPTSSGSETMVLDQDSQGRLWVAWEGGNTIWTAWTTSTDHTTWSQPLALRSGVDSDDIATVVAFDGKIGVFWSDQNRDEFGFRMRHDFDAPEIWNSVEIVDAGDGLADDHISLKAGLDGTLYAVTKDDHDKMFFYRRKISNGEWVAKDDVISGVGTRGMLMVSDDDEKVYVAYTDWSASSDKIKLRRARFSSWSFKTEVSSLISGGTFNNATGTKQVLPQGCFMAMAAGPGGTWWNGWGELPPDGPPPPAPPEDVSVAVEEIARPEVKHADLVLHMPLDEGAGTATQDASGHTHHGELDGSPGKGSTGPGWIPGYRGGALHFDGGSWVRVESSDALRIAGSFTLEAWVRRDASAADDGTILVKGPTNDRNYAVLLQEDGRILFKWEVSGGDNRGLTSNQALAPDQWQHVCCIYDKAAGRSRIYIDGQLDGSTSDTGTPVTNDEPLYLGRRISGSTSKDYLVGDVDGVRIWDGVAFHGDFEPGEMPYYPDPPTAQHEIALQWNPPSGEERPLTYRITRTIDGAQPHLLADDLSSTTWTDRHPVFGELCYEIRAFSAEDNRLGYPEIVCTTYRPQRDLKENPERHELAKSAPAAGWQLAAAPNPFNPQTRIRLQVPHSGPARLAVYDVRGRQVRLLHRGMLTAGMHEFRWDAHADGGERVASGVYFLRGQIQGEALHHRLVLLK